MAPKARLLDFLLLAASASALLLLLPTAATASSPPLLRPRGRALLLNGTTNRLAAPSIECVSSTLTSIRVQVCPGKDHPTAPYGFKLQWEELDTFVENGGWCCPAAGDSADVCAARTAMAFTGASDCWTLRIGGGVAAATTYNPPRCGTESLFCGTQYAVRAFALGGAAFNGSVASAGEVCATQPCPSDPCEDDGDCPMGEVCTCGFCAEAIPECADDQDCAAAKMCEAGGCVARECLAASDCDAPGEVCRDGRCRV